MGGGAGLGTGTLGCTSLPLKVAGLCYATKNFIFIYPRFTGHTSF